MNSSSEEALEFFNSVLIQFGSGQWESVIRPDPEVDDPEYSSGELLHDTISAIARARSGDWNALIILQIWSKGPENSELAVDAATFIEGVIEGYSESGGENKYFFGLAHILFLFAGLTEQAIRYGDKALSSVPADLSFDEVIISSKVGIDLGAKVTPSLDQEQLPRKSWKFWRK